MPPRSGATRGLPETPTHGSLIGHLVSQSGEESLVRNLYPMPRRIEGDQATGYTTTTNMDPAHIVTRIVKRRAQLYLIVRRSALGAWTTATLRIGLRVTFVIAV